MKPIFCRIGSKYLMSKQIIDMFPEYDKYVEVFCGSSAVLFKKDKVDYEVINDLDIDLINDYKMLMKIDNYVKKHELNTIPLLQDFIRKSEHDNIQDKFTNKLIRRCNGFSSQPINVNTLKVYQQSDPNRKLKNLHKYQERLKNVIITSVDYKIVLDRHDSKDCLFYLDPPYENSKSIYRLHKIDYKELAECLKKLKGKFVMSMNDSPNIRLIFKDFKFKILKLRTYAPKTSKTKIGCKPRVEILIYNF
jgi:DNA adenine methylase